MAALLLVVITTVWTVSLMRVRPEPRVLQFIRLTNDGHPKAGPLVTDGDRLFFNGLYDGFNRVVSFPVLGTSGEPQPLKGLQPDMALKDISPDRHFLLIVSGAADGGNRFWKYSLANARLEMLTSGGDVAVWEPRSDSVTVSGSKFVSSYVPASARKTRLLDLPGPADYLAWSPDGRFLRLTLKTFGGEPVGIWEFDRRNSVRRKLNALSKPGQWTGSGRWSSDGGYFFYVSGDYVHRDLWVSKEKHGWLGGSAPVRLTNGPDSWTWPAPMPDGSELFAIHDEWRTELSYFDREGGQWRSGWKGFPAYELDYSRDGQWITFVYPPDHTVWKARQDGSARVPLTSPGIVAHQPHWSPDGRSIAFMGQKQREPWRVFIVSAQGGQPNEVLPSGDDQGVPTWSPDGQQLFYGERLGRREPSAMCLHAIDLNSRTARDIPGSHGLWSPRWSPDGKHILAVSTDNKSVKIASGDWNHWSELVRFTNVDNVMWSYDSKYIHFDGRLQPDDAQDLYRVSIETGILEKLAGMRDFVAPLESWYGVSPDGSLLAAKGYTVQEVYALKCQLP